MKIVNIIGARPQFIKYVPVSKAIEKINASGHPVRDVLVHTGQHYDYSMSKIFFDELGIKEPDYHLGVGSGPHGMQTASVLQKTEEVCLQERPDIVVVYGDTNSTLGGALASAKLHVPIAHVEAGLRSFNKCMPEEINRILTDHISSVLFCPTNAAVDNLCREGFEVRAVNGGPPHISSPLIINTGDVMYDALLYSLKIAEEKSSVLRDLDIAPKTYRVLTVHRAENTDNEVNFKEIIDFVNDTSSGSSILFPMHPRTRKVYENIRTKFSGNVRIIGPVGYFDFLTLVKNSELVMTDSGGLQKEAYWLKVPCVTLRHETEWVETVQSGWNVLYRDYKGSHRPSEAEGLLYGDGRAAERIVETLIGSFECRKCPSGGAHGGPF
ncbi:MAG: UDP-N-acetylglucosamine 2-epimerase (non-hydrolyzing) [Nitrospirae bacterium]|nr:UDP-N-acetylglucosamine 2-epimerase (non-hydrolyzing) [Nitrospirota bacterium]